jgi:predicted CoA-binding protein
MPDLTDLLHDAATTIAVVGATDRPGKYGGIIYRDLKAKGYRVFAVNPSRSTVDGDPAFPNLAALPEAPTIVNYVVPPPTTLRVLRHARRLGLHRAWVQPGAGDEAVRDYLGDHGFDGVVGPCIMVESRGIRFSLPPTDI